MFKRIVVGYAGEQAGRDAVRLAGALGAPLASQLTVVFPYHPLFAARTAEEQQTRVSEEVRTLLAELGGTPPPASYHWSSSSWPIRALHELARYEHADLIVLGAARETLSDHMHVSVMERMIHGAPCAVAIAPSHYAERAATPIRRIGVGYAGSDDGRLAVAVAHSLAERFTGRLLLLAGVCLDPTLASYAFTAAPLPEIEQEMQQETELTLRRLARELADAVDWEVVRGDPARILIERSTELDLLVLGSRAYGPVRHVLLGSVSASTARKAHCPVLIVPRAVKPEELLADAPATVQP